MCNPFPRIGNPFSRINKSFPPFTQLVPSVCNSRPLNLQYAIERTNRVIEGTDYLSLGKLAQFVLFILIDWKVLPKLQKCVVKRFLQWNSINLRIEHKRVFIICYITLKSKTASFSSLSTNFLYWQPNYYTVICRFLFEF